MDGHTNSADQGNCRESRFWKIYLERWWDFLCILIVRQSMEIETLIPGRISATPFLTELLVSPTSTVETILSQPLTFRLFRQGDPAVIDLYF
jgi:hypothetical protein